MAEILLGGKVLARRFAALERNAQSRILAGAVTAGAEVIRQEAERLAPRDPRTSDHAAEQIKHQQGRVTRTEATAEIGYDKRKAWYLRFQELGTKHHRAQPHLRPAMDTKKGEAANAVGRVLRLGIDAARRA